MKYIILRSLPIDRDSRVKRYVDILYPEGKYIFLTFECKESSKLLKLARYIMFILKIMILLPLIAKENDIVIAMDLDMFIFSKSTLFLRKNIRIYLDIVDPIAETKFRHLPNFMKGQLDKIEYLLLNRYKYNILPADHRKYYYKEKLGVDVNNLNYIVIENIAKYNYCNSKKLYPLKSNKFVVGYFGSLEIERGIMELINWIINHDDLELVIAGRGSLENDIDKFKDKITFLGAYKPEQLPSLYEMIDFTWAYYNVNSGLLHYKYACPNKYYEHLIFKTPIIMNRGVYISNLIVEIGTGIVIDDNLNSEYTFNKMYKEMLEFVYKEDNFEKMANKYKNYRVNILNYGFHDLSIN